MTSLANADQSGSNAAMVQFLRNWPLFMHHIFCVRLCGRARARVRFDVEKRAKFTIMYFGYI